MEQIKDYKLADFLVLNANRYPGWIYTGDLPKKDEEGFFYFGTILGTVFIF